MPRLSSWKESPSGRVEPSGGFFFCLSLKICEFMVFKVEKSVFKNAVAVYFQYTKKKFNNYNARYVRVRIRASARRAGRGRRNPRGGLTRLYGAGARLRENSFSVQKNCALNAEGLSPYRHQFILAGYARANKRTPRPPCRFSVFLHACSVPLRWGERAFFWSFPGRSPAARAVSRGKARRAPPRPTAPRRESAHGLPRPPLCVVLEVPPARIRATGMKKERQNAVLPRFWLQNTKKCDRI